MSEQSNDDIAFLPDHCRECLKTRLHYVQPEHPEHGYIMCQNCGTKYYAQWGPRPNGKVVEG